MKKAIPMYAWVRPVLRQASLLGVIALGLAACGQPTTNTTPTGATGPAASRPAPAGSHTSAPPRASADTQLAAFFAAAQQADAQLRHTAALVNGDIGATSMRFTPATLAAIRALSNAPAAHAIPAGLPTELLRQVLVVYGDLASRTASFSGVSEYGSSGQVLPIRGRAAKEVLRGLRNGAPAAARFSSDLAAARAGAVQTPRITVAAPQSRAAAELALRLASVGLRNGCSAEYGGWAPTSLEPVSWQPSTGQAGHYAGTISGIRFRASYTAQHTWNIAIYAC